MCTDRQCYKKTPEREKAIVLVTLDQAESTPQEQVASSGPGPPNIPPRAFPWILIAVDTFSGFGLAILMHPMDSGDMSRPRRNTISCQAP